MRLTRCCDSGSEKLEIIPHSVLTMSPGNARERTLIKTMGNNNLKKREKTVVKPTVPFFVVEYFRRIHSGREIVEVRVVHRSVFAADFDEIWAHNL